MKKLFLMGRSEAGKTSLTQILNGEELHYHKTQYTNTGADIIDSPGEYSETKRCGLGLACFSFEADVLALLIAAVVAAVVALFGSRIAGVFNSDPAVQELAGSYLRLSCLSYFGFATVHPLIGFLRGTGNSMVNFYNVFLSQYAVRIPVAFLCTRLMGFSGIAVAVIIGPIVSTLLYAWYIASGRWKRSAEAKEGLALAEKRAAQPGD